MKLLGIVGGAIVGILILGWALGWMGGITRVGSVDNVRDQYADGYRNFEALKASARNACRAQNAVERAVDANERTQRQTQLVGQEQNYERIAASYNAAMADAFRAKYVKPADLPQSAPTLEEMKAAACTGL